MHQKLIFENDLQEKRKQNTSEKVKNAVQKYRAAFTANRNCLHHKTRPYMFRVSDGMA